MFEVVSPWTGEIMECYIHEDEYVMGKRLALSLLECVHYHSGPCIEPYCFITVNIPGVSVSGEDCAFVDVNNAPFIEGVLRENNLAEPTGRVGFSGFCSYPEYRFNMEEVRKHEYKPGD